MRSSRTARVVVVLALAVVGVLVAPRALASPALASPAPRPHAAPPAWLAEVNLYRNAAGLPSVTDDPAEDQGLRNHFVYLERTDPSLRTRQYASAHTENPASPYYTQSGADEGGASDLIEGAVGYSAVQDIDAWLTAPFHAIGMLRPALTSVAFAQDAASGDAGLDVIHGLTGNASSTPTLFPGPGMTTYLNTFGGEYPDPLESCHWSGDVQPGLPIIALLPSAPSSGLTASLAGPTGTQSTANGQLCVVDEKTYTSSDSVYGPTGEAILQGDHAVLLVPKTPLTWGRYTPVISQPGASDIRWSFVAATAGPVAAGHAYVLHLTDGPETVVGNLTVTDPVGAGYTTAYACSTGRPLASNSNYGSRQTVANLVVARTDANGDLCLYTSATASLVWDQSAATDAITTTAPQRLLDTRVSHTRPAAGGTVQLHVTDGGAQTVLGNLTVTAPAAAGYTTAWPCDQPRPTTSVSNYGPGQTIANAAAVHPDAAGDICLYTSAAADLVWDQTAATNAITTTAPQRLLDTRVSHTRPSAGGTVTVHVTDGGAQTVLGNLTVTRPAAPGYTTTWPCDQTRPTASTSNYVTDQTVANAVAVHPDAAGDVCVYTSAAADLVWDQSATTTAVTTTAPRRLLDTRSAGSHL